MRELKGATLCGFITSLLFFIISLAFYFADWERLIFVTVLGFCLGWIAAPEIEPKAFKNPSLFQLLSGTVSGGLMGWILSSDPISISIGFVLGGLFGWVAPFWLKHIPIP